MTRPRTFDYEEARRLRSTGLSYESIGQLLGVSDYSARMACNPGARERKRLQKRVTQTSRCVGCGAICSFNVYVQDEPRCWACACEAKAKVRDGKAFCPTCGRWKLLKEFSPSSVRPYRGVHNECRPCQTVRRRENRQNNRERERAYERARYHRRKAAA